MPYAGRTGLLALMDELIREEGGPRIPADVQRPVVLLDGIGGSGRSHVLERIRTRWAGVAPVAHVSPLTVEDEPASLRTVLRAVMLHLSGESAGYGLSFPRVVLAHIAMAEPIDSGDARQDVDTLQKRIAAHREQDSLARLLEPLITDAAGALGLPVANTAVEVVRRLRGSRWRARLAWNESLEWFRHQDQGFQHDPRRALVLLSRQAARGDGAVRQDVDHLLMSAFLADLRESLARAENHPAKAVVLLDDGDALSARAFLRTFLQVREELRQRGTPGDPLVLVTTRGRETCPGVLGAGVGAESGSSGSGSGGEGRSSWRESSLERLTPEDIPRPGTGLCVVLEGFTRNDVQQMVRARLWPEDLGTAVVTEAVHRLTGGHAEAVTRILALLSDEPELLDRLGDVLTRPLAESAPGTTLEEHLVDKFAVGLGPGRRVDRRLREDVVTLAAARDQREARWLTQRLPDRFHHADALLTSPALWPEQHPDGQWGMTPFVRLLLLRALAARAEAEPERYGEAATERPPTWREAFGALRDRAARDRELAPRLSCDLSLGNADPVVTELLALLPESAPEEWLATYDVVREAPCPDGIPATAAEGPRQVLTDLLRAEIAYADPLLGDRERRADLCSDIARCFHRLDDRGAFQRRYAQWQAEYVRLSAGLN
ncbi:hypothetical protein [Streptomyces sp. ODS28]|uniref:hypothetical protein n=1 Tax=Streptomyces sp. ODS28 TaxID=3136688 RepID=UPI0031EBF1E5